MLFFGGGGRGCILPLNTLYDSGKIHIFFLKGEKILIVPLERLLHYASCNGLKRPVFWFLLPLCEVAFWCVSIELEVRLKLECRRVCFV